jgi:hypothetical protein
VRNFLGTTTRARVSHVPVHPWTTVNDVFKIIGIPDQVDRSFFVNRRHADLITQLNEGDTLLVLTLLGGG